MNPQQGPHHERRPRDPRDTPTPPMPPTASKGPTRPGDDDAADPREAQLREMNQALLLSSLSQHELADKAVAAEKALRRTEVRYRRLFQAARDGLLLLDAHSGVALDANGVMAGLLGLPAAQIVGRPLWELGLFSDPAACRQAFEVLQREGYLRLERLLAPSLAGGVTHVDFVAVLYREEDRLVAQCNVRDVSEQVRMSAELERQAVALAEQARRKDEFLAMLSHELRNPLAPIRSAVHLLRMNAGRPGAPSQGELERHAHEVIDRQVTTLTRLVSDILEVSRALTGRIRLELQELDLREVLRHSIETARPLIDARGHTLTGEACGEPLWCRGDATRLEEVFVNLLGNAAKYTPKGGRIEVACGVERGTAVVSVHDSGEGLDKDLIPRIFDLFSQGERTLDRAQGGLGIGLSLAHRVVELHGGSIEAASPGRGKGSTFTVRLPLIPTPAAESDATPIDARQEPAPAGELRVLVVDDNVDACLMLSALVQLHGYQARTAHTGTAALAQAAAWHPHALLLDIGLPELDGYEVARRLRAPPLSSDALLVAVTGYGAAKDVELATAAGFDAHIIKPADPEAVVAALSGLQARVTAMTRTPRR